MVDDCTETSCGTIYARRGGIDLAGTPVILVHGLVVTSRYMIPLASRLAAYFPVYALDLPGYGNSSKPALPSGMTELADAIEAWLEAKRFSRVHLVGNSMGCQVIADFATRFPSRVDRIVFLGPTVDPHARSFWRQLWRQMENALYQKPLLPVIAADYSTVGFRRSVAITAITLNDREEEKLPRIPVPVLVVRGSRDPVCPQRWAEEAVRLLPRGELRIIPGGQHVLNFSMPREVVRVMLPFLHAEADIFS
ncbi:alpha/beta hydrolase [Geomonas sp. RF6]|uniref:alpha/beta fold hydrolase n=1 Tax=Geomonas sp. RF6 TaxID=2897342 RepID=UPI001E371840|nr:alpha/beta hydrolase [Geomonas sp. RF6]UFS70137.1 alpha/beta hydrolase [Geomonas sp. RF6]